MLIEKFIDNPRHIEVQVRIKIAWIGLYEICLLNILNRSNSLGPYWLVLKYTIQQVFFRHIKGFELNMLILVYFMTNASGYFPFYSRDK